MTKKERQSADPVEQAALPVVGGGVVPFDGRTTSDIAHRDRLDRLQRVCLLFPPGHC